MVTKQLKPSTRSGLVEGNVAVSSAATFSAVAASAKRRLKRSSSGSLMATGPTHRGLSFPIASSGKIWVFQSGARMSEPLLPTMSLYA